MMNKKEDRSGITLRAKEKLDNFNFQKKTFFKETEADELEDIKTEAVKIAEEVFPKTWESDCERWSVAFDKVYEDLRHKYNPEDDEKKPSVIKESTYIKENFKRDNVWNYDILVWLMGEGSIGTFRNWHTGKCKPRLNRRDDVIHLGFLAGYNADEINRLLRNAGLPILYAKGIRANKGGKRNINDYVYSCMIAQHYPFGEIRSFAVAQKCIEKGTEIIKSAVEACIEKNKTEKKKVIVSSLENTLSIRNYIKNSSFSKDEEKWIDEALCYVEEHITDFSFSYVKFMSNIVKEFKENYNISKWGKKEERPVEGDSEIVYDEKTRSIHQFTEGWSGYLAEVFATAFNTTEGILKEKMYLPDREDVIVISLLLCGNWKQTDSYLSSCSFEKLYPASRVEAVIIYALDRKKRLSPEHMVKMIEKEYPEEIAQRIRSQYTRSQKGLLDNIMFKSLQVFGWIELMWEYTGVSQCKEAEDILKKYPKDWLIRNLADEI